MRKKILALLLLMVLVVQSVPVPALATSEAETEPLRTTDAVVDEGSGFEISEEVVGVRESRLNDAQQIVPYSLESSSVTLKSGNYANWIDRINVPNYATHFYNLLVEGSDNDGVDDFLIDDSYFSLNAGFRSTASVYRNLQVGDVLHTDSYAGVLAAVLTSSSESADNLQKQYGYDCVIAAYDAFDRDHPEVFWLGNAAYVSSVTLYDDAHSRYTSYIFLWLAGSDGTAQLFDIRNTVNYPNANAIRQGISDRNTAVQTILSDGDYPATGSNAEKVRFFNRWLTTHNQYNTSANLDAVTGPIRTCLCALEGNIGRKGPVCEGYARALKVLCDATGIPCTLVDGYASSGSIVGEAHMWNYVQIDGAWYAVDVTWNDPSVANEGSAAVSGYESENYLLVGADTIISGRSFLASHPVNNQASSAGVHFTNGPQLNSTAYDFKTASSSTPAEEPETPQEEGLPFSDVSTNDWFYTPIVWAYGEGLMTGTGATTFAPNTTTTRAMIVAILHRLEGSPTVNDESFTDVTDGDWCAEAVYWAASVGIVAGFDDGSFQPNTPVTREQLAAILCNYAEWKGSTVSARADLSGYSDQPSAWAMDTVRWAVAEGLLTGVTADTLAPQAATTRAQTAAVFQRFLEA